MLHADLIFANMLRRSGIDAPVEAENASEVVGLQALRFTSRSQHKQLRRRAGEVNQQGDRTLSRAENSPVRGAGALQAGMHYILRMVSFVGLRDQATAAVEQVRHIAWQVGKGTDGKTANAVGG